MRRFRLRALALAATVGVPLALVLPSTALAYYGDEENGAAASGGPTGEYYCVSITGATACFRPTGDDFFVKDTKADGASAVLEWRYDGYSRTGSCINSLGSGKWGWCNKDFTENKTMEFRAARYDNGRFVDDSYDVLAYT
ncbi:hypothetical protein K1W54_02475 [Micromonospora sp. CPCC 205371]|nr:hypothetical protein [Micromonospora sp. CPCC 205371]